MVVYVIVSVVSLSCYFNGLSGDFVHDDIPAVSNNPDVLGTTSVFQLFNNDFWGTPMSDVNSHKSYRPLTTLTFRINHWLFGLQPKWFHVFNILLHTISCILFTRVTLVVAGLDAKYATAAGLLFAAHPIHTEAVTGIVGRADVLACLLFLLSFLVYHDGGLCWERKHRVLLSCVLAALSMLAKETGFTVLLVNLLYDIFKCYPHVKRVIVDGKWNEESVQFARRTGTIFMAMSVLLVFRLAMLQGSLPKFSSQDNPTAFHPCPHVRLLTFSFLATFNFWLLLCPSTLSHDWQMGSIPLVTSLADCRNIATCVFFGVCLLLAFRCFSEFENQRNSPLILGCLLLVVPFLPATNVFVTVGFVVAERVLYIPSLGAVLIVIYGVQQLHNSSVLRQKSLILACFLLVFASFFLKTIDRNRAWSSRESLVRSGIKTLPHNAKMHYNFANYLRDANHIDMAITHYREALSLWPSYASAHNNLGTLMHSAPEAEVHFQSAINISPNHVNAHYNLGQVYRKMNRTTEAVAILERCLRLDSTYTPAYLLLAKLHPIPLAGRLLHHVTFLHPRSPDYLAYYAGWLHDLRRFPEALRFYLRALGIQKDHLISLVGATKCLRAQGQISRLHQTIIRWHRMSRSNKGRRLVYAGELYIRTEDAYKDHPSTVARSSSQGNCNRELSTIPKNKTSKQGWWRICNQTGGTSFSDLEIKTSQEYNLVTELQKGEQNIEGGVHSSSLCVNKHDQELNTQPGR